jgi:hypothetical protein
MSLNFKDQDIEEEWQKQVDQCLYRKTVIPVLGQQDIFWKDHTDSSNKMRKVNSESRGEDNRLRTGQHQSCRGGQTTNTSHAGNQSNNGRQNLHGLDPEKGCY